MRNRWLRCVPFVFAMVLGADASAQWTVVRLHPPGEVQSSGEGAGSGKQIGLATISGANHASLWSGTAASRVDLHPATAEMSEGWDVDGTHQVGRARIGQVIWHASLWTGTAGSWVDLNPVGAGEGAAVAVNGTQQVGWTSMGAGLRASLWTGTAASWTDLTPAVATVGAALGTSGTQQVGWVSIAGTQHASLWSGTAGSWVDLTPSSSWGSIARDTDGSQQVGESLDSFFTSHASLWSGTAGSWIDLSPAGTSNSIAYGVRQGVQVGMAWAAGNRAYLWRGNAESAVDLQFYLPAEFVGSEARDVWVEGGVTYVVGFGIKNGNLREAILWVSDACPAPTLAVTIPSARRPVSGQVTLNVQDPNTGAVTGYNVYRSFTRNTPPATWIRLATNVTDEDLGTPNVQWTDTSGDVSPTRVWYYHVTAYNAGCSAEGPF